MATFSKIPLSASVNGRAVKLAATATPGTIVHTGPVTPTTIHEVWLYAENTSAAAHLLTVEWGGVTVPDDDIIVSVPAQSGLMLVAPGLLIVGNATALIVRAFADLTNVVTVHGFVNVIA